MGRSDIDAELGYGELDGLERGERYGDDGGEAVPLTVQRRPVPTFRRKCGVSNDESDRRLSKNIPRGSNHATQLPAVNC
jgi:hypothetical protein